MRPRTLLVSAAAGLALAAGLAVGGAAHDPGGGGAAATRAAAPRAEPPGDRLRSAGTLVGRTQRQLPSSDRDSANLGRVKTRATTGSLRLVQRVPAGGGRLDWGVRTFERPRVTGGLARNVRADPSRPGIRCAQLGRLREETFGWVMPGGPFRPLAATTDLLAVCGTDASRSGVASSAAVLPDRDPYDPAARPRDAVVWGLAPASAARVRVRWAGWTRTVPVRRGTFLAVGPAPRGPFLEAQPQVQIPGAPDRGAGDASTQAFQRYLRVPENARIAARLVDPATGRPVAAVTGTVDGRPCDGGTVPILAGLVGRVDDVPRTVIGAGAGCQPVSVPRRGTAPVIVGFGGGQGPTEGPDLVARQRLVPGSFSITVLTPPDVVRVELRSTVDVRTVRPIAPGIVHALYDGSGSTGGGTTLSPAVEVIGVRDDGSTIRARGALGRPPVRLGSAELGGR